ncbi:hypothetical protein BU15DRAFT_80810 [Melanogaster broomeanus]|nr:hypothetical protein BU15DRAFT_80810 [Melanogaster broomeanus]
MTLTQPQIQQRKTTMAQQAPKANAPACTTGHCGLDSAIMTMQHSHTSDDATQLHNAPHGRYGLDSATIVTTQCSQPSDNATQPHNAPARALWPRQHISW